MADTRFSSSFIPKTPIVGTTIQKERMSLLTALGGLIFLLSLISIGGVFIYKMMVNSKLNELKAELATLESQVNRQEIARLVSFDKKLESTKEVLTNHVALTNFFKMLELDTLPNVSFTSLKYTAPAGKNIVVSMDGFTSNYRILGEQQKVFLADPNTFAADFKTMSFDKVKRQVVFVFEGEFKSNLVKFAYPVVPTAATSTSTVRPGTATTTATTTPGQATTTKPKN